MTYEEAKKILLKIKKEAIKCRLYEYDPIKYSKFMMLHNHHRHYNAHDLNQVMIATMVVHRHEHGDPLESKSLYDMLKRKTK